MATLTYQAFAKLWKRLISRRRARELNVGLDDVWQQLVTNGRLSPRYRFATDEDPYGATRSSADLPARAEPRAVASRAATKPLLKRRSAR
jgi:hypothetical protein